MPFPLIQLHSGLWRSDLWGMRRNGYEREKCLVQGEGGRGRAGPYSQRSSGWEQKRGPALGPCLLAEWTCTHQEQSEASQRGEGLGSRAVQVSGAPPYSFPQNSLEHWHPHRG